MKSLFHVAANTPEELRAEFVRWLEDQQLRLGTKQDFAKTLRDRAALQAKCDTYDYIAKFWFNIIIDKKPEEDTRE